MDLTRADHQVDRIVSDQRAEALGDASQFELHRALQTMFERTSEGEHRSAPPQTVTSPQPVTSAGWAR